VRAKCLTLIEAEHDIGIADVDTEEHESLQNLELKTWKMQ
jgi:hypothetical protein